MQQLLLLQILALQLQLLLLRLKLKDLTAQLAVVIRVNKEVMMAPVKNLTDLNRAILKRAAHSKSQEKEATNPKEDVLARSLQKMMNLTGAALKEKAVLDLTRNAAPNLHA